MTELKATDVAAGRLVSVRGDCPVCGESDLTSAVTLDDLPVLCNALYPDPDSARATPTGTIALKFCRECCHVFNAAFDEDRIGYTQSYENSLHFSPRFRQFVGDLTERLTRSYALAGKTVVDIGCGKGDFLKQLCAVSGATGIGFDKSFEQERGLDVAGVRFVNDWFGDAYADLRPDLVSCRQVLEHIAEPVSFLRGLRAYPGAGPDTVFYFEVPNVLYTLRDMGIWDLIYEHVSFFTPLSLRRAFEAAGFEVLDAGTSFGEQYLFIEARPGEERQSYSVREVGEIETLVRNFGRRFREKVAQWHDYLAATDPARVVVWGAGSKGITFLNAVPGAERIGAIVDVNIHKQGRFAPGTGTPVVAPEAMRGQPIRSIIVMNPLYRDEIGEAASTLGLDAEIVVA